MSDAFLIGMILGLIISIFINVIIALKMQDVAEEKGYEKDATVFHMCFWFGIIGCIYVAALPDRIQQEQNAKIIKLLKNIDCNTNPTEN